MKEHPIIFSPPMVKAILEGRKTVTRRVIKPQPEYHHGAGKRESYSWKGGVYALNFYPDNSTILDHCPYGKKGDVLWVRETWACEQGTTEKHYFHKASYELLISGERLIKKWNSPRFMPREAARLFLEVKSIRVKRLQDISEADAVREGLPESMTGASKYSSGCFRHLWDSLNADRGYSWESNPWVWVIEFRRVKN